MATVNFTGFETGDLSEVTSSGGTVSIQGTTVRTGGYALRSNPTTTATGFVSLSGLAANGLPLLTGASNVGTSWVRFYFQFLTAPAANDEQIACSFNTLIESFVIRLNSAGNLAAYNGTTLLATGSTVLSSGVWYRIEALVPNNGIASWEIKINGASEISGSSGWGAFQHTTAFRLGKSTNRNGNSVDFYYDDFFWSTTGYPGAGQCAVLVPVGAGNYQLWTIGAGSGSNWQQVNEIPPDGDTTYLVSPLLINDLECETLTTHTAAGITGTINCCKSIAIIKQNVAGGTCRVLLRSNTTDDITSADYTATASYAAICKLYPTDPATTLAWTLNGLDTAQTGAKDTDAANQVRMTFTALMVDYTPAAAPTVDQIMAAMECDTSKPHVQRWSSVPSGSQ